MMQYPKINTLWKRDKNNKFIIIENDYSKKEFASIDQWEVTEKIDGTNIRIMWNGKTETIKFNGRTDKAIIPPILLKYLKEIFTIDKLKYVFHEEEEVIMFGEGYGRKIGKVGIKYIENNKFILFDIIIDKWWLKRNDIEDIAEKLNIKSVPNLGIMTKEKIIHYVKSKPYSLVSKEPLLIEGVVVRSSPLMLFRDGKPIMFKLKVLDYEKLKEFKK